MKVFRNLAFAAVLTGIAVGGSAQARSLSDACQTLLHASPRFQSEAYRQALRTPGLRKRAPTLNDFLNRCRKHLAANPPSVNKRTTRPQPGISNNWAWGYDANGRSKYCPGFALENGIHRCY